VGKLGYTERTVSINSLTWWSSNLLFSFAFWWNKIFRDQFLYHHLTMVLGTQWKMISLWTFSEYFNIEMWLFNNLTHYNYILNKSKWWKINILKLTFREKLSSLMRLEDKVWQGIIRFSTGWHNCVYVWIFYEVQDIVTIF